VTGGGGSITPSSTTNASGIASATRVLGTTLGSQTASATVAGLTGSPVGFTATATAGHAATIALNAGNAQTDTIGATLTSPYTVLVTDRNGDPVAGTIVTWAVTGGGGSITPSSTTNASGIATATRVLGTTLGANAQTASATVTGLTGSPVGFTATATAGTAKTIALSGGNTQTDTIGATLATLYTVVVTDRNGNSVSGTVVTWAVTGGGGSITPSSTTNASGIASATRVLGTTPGSATASAAVTGLTGSPVAFTATVNAGHAATIALDAGNAQTDTIGATLATPYTVLVTDRSGNPVSGTTVTWAVTGGGGSITPSSVTNASGVATATRVLGTAPGSATATASVTGLTGSPVTFTATATTGHAATIALNAGNAQTDTIGATLATAYAVLVTDRSGNPVSGTTVTWAVTGGGGSITPSSVTSVSGIATASRVLGTTAGSATASATVAGLSGSPVAFTATVTAGHATTIALNAGNAQTDTIGATLATAYAVLVTDRGGNPVSGTTVTWAVTTGGGSITPSSTTNASGIASATRMLGTTPGSASASATVAGLTGSPVAFTATVTTGHAAIMALNSGDAQTDTIGASLGTAYAVLVTDRSGNPVLGTTVTWAVTGGGGSITPSSTTNASGIASATRVLGTTPGSATASATVTGLTGSPVAFGATVNAGHAATIALNGGNAQTDTIGATLATAYTVLVTDRAANPVAGTTVTWAVTGGGGSITPSSTTNASGIASVTRVLGPTLGANAQTATATVTGLTGSPVAFTATATAGNAKTIALSAGNTQTDTIGATLATAYTVLVTDRLGNPVSGTTVTWAATGGGGSITPSSVTNASGIATATRVLGSTLGANAQTATATVTGLTGSPVVFTATATAGNAKTIALNGGNTQTDTIGATLPTAYTVLVTDRLGNPVSGTTVTWAVTGGGGSITPSSTTNASGIASATRVLGTTLGANAQTATATVTGLTGSPVAFTATATVGAAKTIALSGGNTQTDTIGATLVTAYTVLVTDRLANPVQNVTVTWAVTGGGGSITPSSTTNASGIASATRVLGTTLGANAQIATATVTGLTGSPVTFTATATVGNAKTIALSAGNAQTDTIGATLTTAYAVLVTDRNGNPVSGTTVTWAVTGGGGSITPSSATNASGIASATRVLGTTLGTNAQTASATVTGLTGSPVAFAATATVGNAKTIALNAGNAQTDTAGATLAISYTVLVTDRLANPVANVTVTWAVTGGGGSITPSSTTSASGIASATRVLGTTLGANAQTATATVTGLTGSPVTFTATATAGNAKTIVLSAGNAQTDTIGATLGTAYSVLVTDGGGNPVAGITVTWAATGGGGSITPSSITNASGIASATRVLGNTLGANAQTATATVTGLTGSPVTFTATATVGNAKTIALSAGNAQTDTIGATLATAYSVLVTDRLANPVQNVTVTWAATGGGGSITPSSTTNASGLASATRVLGSTLGASAQTATATVTGLTGSPVSFTATATVGNAKTIALSGGNAQTDTVGATLATPYTVLVTDRLANPVANVTVTWAVTGGGGSITPSSTTNASGIASATRVLGTTTGANAQTATAAVTGLTGSPVTFTATATAGSAKTIGLAGGNAQTDTIGATLATAYTVLVTDAVSNPVAGVTVTWTASGGGSITPSSVTNASGIASATRVLGTTAGPQGASATVTGLTGSPVAFTATATAGHAATIALNGGNAQSDTISATLATAYTVLVTDRGSNPVSGTTVTWATTGGGGSITPSSTTNASGIASATRVLGTTLGANAQTASATVTGLTGSPIAFTATAKAGNAKTIALNAGNAQTDTVGATLATPYTVLVTDRLANPVANVTVTWAATGGGGSITPSSTTNASGIASATRVLGTTLGANAQTATATVTGLTGSPVAFTATATAGNAKTIALSAGNAQTDTIGATLGTAYSVLVTDAGGNPVSGTTVTWAVTGGGGSITPSSITNASGIASATRVLGNTLGANAQTATATVTGLTGSPVAFTATATVGNAKTIALSAGNAQTDTIGATLATAYSVLVTDRLANPVQNVTVTWAATGGGGSITPSSTTNASGIASATRVLGTTTGANAQTATATVTGLTGSPVTFTATAIAGNAKTIALSAGNAQTDTIGATLATPYTVLVTDRNGDPVSGTVVTWAVTGGGGSITPSSTTNASGIASATRVLGSTLGANAQTATATVTGLTGSPVTFTATATVGNAKTMALSAGNAQTDTIGATLATAYTVLVTDRNGNPVSGTVVTWAVTGGAGSITPSSTTNASGIASATRVLGTTLGANAQTATATVTGLTGSPVAFTATATAGHAKTIALSGGNAQTDTIGATLATAYTVLVTDRNGNPVSGTTVTWAVTGGGGSITPSSTTNASGIASATRALGTTAGSATATATVAGLTGSPVGFSATVNPGNVSASQSTVVATSPITAASDSSTVTVTALDRAGNPISGASVTISSDGTDTYQQPGSTDSNGVATGYVKAAGAETSVVSATVNGVAISQTATVMFQ